MFLKSKKNHVHFQCTSNTTMRRKKTFFFRKWCGHLYGLSYN